MVNRINRRPVHEEFSEATYVVYATCSRSAQPEVREKLVDLLEAANYPVRDVAQHAFGQDDAEIEATLYATAVEPEELDKVVSELEAQPGIRQAFWNASAED